MSRTLLLVALAVGCSPAPAELPEPLREAWAGRPEAKIPVLVRHEAPTRLLGDHGLRARRTFRHVPITLVELDEAEARALAGRPGVQLFLDAPIGAAGKPVDLAADPDIVRRAVGADRVHDGDGLTARTGAGVTVALVDSGVWTGHHDLGAAVVAHADFVDADGDGIGDDPAAALDDPYGHGTMVAGVLVGDRAGVRGVAPDVDLVVARVLDDRGQGSTSSAIAAIDWIVSEADTTGVDILHLSIGAAPQGSFVDDPLAVAVEAALDAGVVVVAAAGNYGASDGGEAFGGVVSPAIHPGVIAVGALDGAGTAARSDDTVATFSSRGPTAVDGFGKPDLVAPGVALPLAARPGSTLWSSAPRAHLRHWPGVKLAGGHYVVASGTSFAAPAVTGAVALALEEAPGLGAVGVRAALQLTAQAVDDPTGLAAGAGALNAYGATRLAASWREREAGGSPAPLQTEDVLEGETVPWALTVLWDGWLTTQEDVSWLNDDGVLAVGELDPLGIIWDGIPTRYVGVRLSGVSLLDGRFAYSRDIWGTGILWDGVGVTRGSSRVWSAPSTWQTAFVWPDNMARVGLTSPLFEPVDLEGLVAPVDGAVDPRPVAPDFVGCCD